MHNQNFGLKYRILTEKKDKDGNLDTVEDKKFLPHSDNSVVDFLLDLFTTDYDSSKSKNKK